MKVAPVRAETVAADAPAAEIVRETLPDVTVPKSQAKSAKRAGLD